MKKKIIHLISTNVFSGAENVACQIIAMFNDEMDYEMIYVSPIGFNKKSLQSRKINYYELKKFDFNNVKKAILTLKPNIIHAHDVKASIMASFFGNKIKIISHIHANHENMTYFNLKPFLYNITTKKYDKIIWVSRSAFENYYFKSNVKNKSVIIYNIINSNYVRKKIMQDSNEYPNYDLIYLGRLVEQKNPYRLIEIIDQVSKRLKIKVAIVGDGNLFENIKKEVEKRKLTKIVKLYGFVENPYKILNSSKLMIMTSYYEGTPMCALEAMSLGKPIISTPTDGIRDIVNNGENGYLSNENMDLVNYIIELIQNSRRLAIMSNKSLKQFNKICNIDDYKEKLKKIYEN